VTDDRDMASLPVPRFTFPARSRRTETDAPPARNPSDDDPKLAIARRMQDRDRARAATSVAPPRAG
jgi:hypothetical protein